MKPLFVAVTRLDARDTGLQMLLIGAEIFGYALRIRQDGNVLNSAGRFISKFQRFGNLAVGADDILVRGAAPVEPCGSQMETFGGDRAPP